MKRIFSEEQKARLRQQVARWYRDNKDWANPKRYATRRMRYATDPIFREKILASNRKSKTLLKAA